MKKLKAFAWWGIGSYNEKLYRERVDFEEIICKDISFNIENIKCIKKENNLAELTFTLVNNREMFEDIMVTHDTRLGEEMFEGEILDLIDKTNIGTGEIKIIGPIMIDRSPAVLFGYGDSIYITPGVKYDNEFGIEFCFNYSVEEKFECV